MSKSKKIIMIISVLIIAATLFVPPIFGKGDDGSLFALLSGNGLYTPDGAEGFVARYGADMPADNAFFVLSAAKAISGIFTKNILDIRFAALLYLPFYALGVCLVIAGVKMHSKKLEPFAEALAAIILCDIGYIAYLNSPYTDAFFLCALVLLFGCVFYMQSRGRAEIFPSAAAALCALALLWGALGGVPSYKDENMEKYNSVFMGAAQKSEDLAFFGISDKYASLIGKDWYEAQKETDIESDAAKSEIFENISGAKVLKFYFTHPKNFATALDTACKNAPFLTQKYIKMQTDGSYGIKKAPSLWSWARRFMTPASLIVFAVYYIAVIAVLIKTRKKGKGFKLASAFYLLYNIILLPMTLVSGGTASVSRRLLLFQLSCDMLIFMSVLWAVNTFTERNENIKKKYGVK